MSTLAQFRSQVKRCCRCKETKNIDDFYNNRGTRDGKTADCRVCSYERSKAWKEANPDKWKAITRQSSVRRKDANRDYTLRRKYGISMADFDALLLEQGGVCAICGGGPTARYQQLDVDHDHETGQVRGLLCGSCNRGMGLMGDSVNALISAATYLIRSQVCPR